MLKKIIYLENKNISTSIDCLYYVYIIKSIMLIRLNISNALCIIFSGRKVLDNNMISYVIINFILLLKDFFFALKFSHFPLIIKSFSVFFHMAFKACRYP